MKDTRPLSERFDLGYIKHKHFAERWTGKLGMVFALAAVGWFGFLAAQGNDAPYSSGPLTSAHELFADDCIKCHAPNMQKGRGYFLPASDDRCLVCHEDQASIHATNQVDLFAGNAMRGHPDVRLSSNCSACHVEHRGRDNNLSDVRDQLCINCHENLEANGIKGGASSPALQGASGSDGVQSKGGER